MKSNPRRQNLYARLRKNFLSEFFEAIIAAVIVAALLRFFVIGVYRVPTESMMPNLMPGDFIVAWKTSYGVQLPFVDDRIGQKVPHRGDVVIFNVPDEDTVFVKRVIGIPGDRIEIQNGTVTVNEKPTTGTAVAHGNYDIYDEVSDLSTHRVMRRRDSTEADFLAPLVVPPGHVFLMGDYRTDSYDSRQWGPVAIEQIQARASFIGMSLRIEGRNDVSDALVELGGLGGPAASRVRADRFFRLIE